MIFSISEKDDASYFPCDWWRAVSALQDRRIEFKSGLNVIVGPNGSGKTTLVKTLARIFMCEQGGRVTITQASIDGFFGGGVFGTPRQNRKRQSVCAIDSFDVEHDGSGVYYFDPSFKTGLVCDGAAFDDDFMMDGVMAMIDKGSTGQRAMRGFNRIFSMIIDDSKSGEFYAKNVSAYHEEKVSLFMDFFKGSGNYPCLLFDEPCSGLDARNQIDVWNILHSVAMKRGIQVIVASHSIIPMKMNANFIELEEGYREECLDKLGKLNFEASDD